MTRLLKLTLVAMLFLGMQNTAEACHAIALVNFTQQDLTNPNQISVTAASDSPTCGCDEYWLDLEVRCINEAFDAAPFNPGFWGPLATYPYFQSGQMLKPSCTVQNYPWIAIPYAGLCAGMTYQYRMRENHNGQVGPWCATQQFTVPGATAPLVAGATASQTNICAGDCVTLTGSVVAGCGLAQSYSWDNGAGNNATATVCPNVTTTYTVTIDEQCSGFQATASVTINVLPPPVAGTATVAPTPICAGNPVTLTLTGSAGTIQWQTAPNAGGPWTNIAGADTAVYVTANQMADACFRAEVSGCGGAPVYSNVVCITVDPQLTADFTYVPGCSGDPTALTDNSVSAGGPINQWEWDIDNDGVIDYTTQNINHIFGTVGPHDVTLTVTNTTGCTSTTTIQVTLNPGPTADFTFNTLCEGTGQTVFTDASTGTFNTWAWDVDGDMVTDYTTQNVNHTYANEGLYDVTLTVSQGNCSGTITYQVAVYPEPVADYTVQSACLNTPSTFTDQSTVSNTNTVNNIIQWDWDFDGDGVTDFSGPVPPNQTYITAGTINTSLTVTTDNGCVHTTIIPLDVFDQPVADFTFTDECVDQAANFVDASTITAPGTVNTWSWDVNGDGVTDYTSQNPSHTYPADGAYNVTLIAGSGAGCNDTITQTINMHAIPVPNFTSPSECEYDCVQFTSTSTVNAPSTIASEVWDFGDASGISAATNPCHMYANAGTYNVQLIVTSDMGCVKDVTIPVTVFPQPNAGFTATNVCENQPPTVFTNTSNVSSGSIVTYDWDFDDGNATGIQDPTHNYANTGSYNVTLIAFSDFGCSDTITIPVDVLPMPTAAFTADVTEGCPDFCPVFTDQSLSNATSIVTWNWNLGNSQTSAAQNPTTCYPNASNTQDMLYDVQLIVTNDLGCSDTLFMPSYMTAHPNPIADFVADPEVTNEYDAYINFSNSSVGGDTYDWDFADGQGSQESDPSHFFSNTGIYDVTLVTSTIYGCVDSVTYPVEIVPVPTIFVPNTFTPDGDGINDVFAPTLYAFTDWDYEFTVLDRWGQIIFESRTQGEAWDGSVKGFPVNSKTDVFVWKVKLRDSGSGDKKEYVGHVTLLK